jgi:two-component sensor histidine kinase
MDGMDMVNTLDGLPNNTIWCGLADRNGVLWFGTSDGVARIERGVVKPLPPGRSLRGQRVLSIHEDGQGRIWCGTREGLSVFGRDEVLQHYPAGEDGPGRSIRSIVEGRDGTLWLASDQGISRFDGRAFSRYTTSEGLSDNTVSCLLMDASGRLWAGTSNGLTCHTGEQFVTRRFAADFGSNFINLLLADRQGRIWAGTNNGLFLFHPDSLLADPSAHQHIGSNDGLRSLEFNLNAGYRDGRGRLLFGSTGGLVFHDVERHLDQGPPPVPRVHITAIRSFLQATDWRDRCDSLDRHGVPGGLRLPPGRNHLTFDYTGISLTDPDRVLYQYRLLGSNDDWLPPTEARFASYSNLGHGDHTFQVKASLGDGRWSDAVSFSFGIDPPFWLRWWFFLLVAITVSGLLWAVQRYRAIRRARHERTRQLMLRSRMLQLEQQALNANMNRHFVFNALNSIQYHINKQDRATASRYLTSFAKLIRKNLDASQNDTTTLAEELERLELYLTLEHMRFKDRFRYRIEVAPGIDTHQVRLPAMMLQPYVENSIWHGILPMKQQGEVSITVAICEKDRVMVRIEDNGIGLEQSQRAKQEYGSDHISRGIEITKGRADVLRRLELTDIRITGPEQWQLPGSDQVLGTQVTIELPLNGLRKKLSEDLQSPSSGPNFGTR